MKKMFLSAALTLLAAFQSVAEPFIPITTQQQYQNKVVGKTSRTPDGKGHFLVKADGTISGMFSGKVVVGTWRWSGGRLCTTVIIGTRARPERCKSVAISGQRLRVRSDGREVFYNIDKVQPAQDIDGLYQPAGMAWSCLAEDIGMDGGALAIQDGTLHGVENSCKLTDPKPTGQGVLYTAVCSGEGMEYSEQILITPTADGVELQRNGYTIQWSRCPKLAMSKPSNGLWYSANVQGVRESATRDRNGNAIRFSCNPEGQGGRLYIHLAGKPIAGGAVRITVDGVPFWMQASPLGGEIATDCPVCAKNYAALWRATAAGRLMTITTPDGQQAAFSLRGSGKALGRMPCQP